MIPPTLSALQIWLHRLHDQVVEVLRLVITENVDRDEQWAAFLQAYRARLGAVADRWGKEGIATIEELEAKRERRELSPLEAYLLADEMVRQTVDLALITLENLGWSEGEVRRVGESVWTRLAAMVGRS